jgi:hypothetical protein
MLKRMMLLSLALAILALAPLAAAADTMWLHVRVDEKHDSERVRINLPLDLVEELLPLIEVDELRNGKLQIDNHDLEDLVAIRQVQEALRKAEDGEYIEVEDEEDRVTVSKKGDELLVHVEEDYHRRGDREHVNTVDMRIPLTVVEALFSGEEDELNLLAAVQALKKEGAASMITVDEEDTSVRIWIDDKSSQD